MKFNQKGKEIVIDTPFTLNEDQEEALLQMQTFYNDPQQNQFTLSGYAGTGKSTIINLFHKFLLTQYVHPIYSAPTHRALAVIRQMNSQAIVGTLAKLFGLRPQFNVENGDYKLEDVIFNQQGKPQLNRGDFLIIDEASMVNEALYDFIQINIKSLKLKVIYSGDPAQIKPVKEVGLSKVFLNNNGKIFNLTKVERTGDNPILWESTALRKGHDFSRHDNLNEQGEGVLYIGKPEIHPILKEEFAKIVDIPLYIRCLSGTNKMVAAANSQIRKILGYTDQIHEGEVLMGYDNFALDYHAGTYKVINSGDYQVHSIIETQREVLKMHFRGYEVKVQNVLDLKERPKTIFIVSNDEDTSKVQLYVTKIRELNIEAEAFRKAGNFKMMAQRYSASNELKSLLAFMKDHLNTRGEVFQKRTLDYGYSHSIHKS